MVQESITDNYIIFKAVYKLDQVGYANEKGQENFIYFFRFRLYSDKKLC